MFYSIFHSSTRDLVLLGASSPSSLDRNFILLRWISPAASWSLTPSGRGLKVSPSSSVINQANSIPTHPPVLSSKQFARRWRECNKRIDSPPLDDDEEEAWRTRSLDLLSNAHTLGGILELSFEVFESKFGVLFPLSSRPTCRLMRGVGRILLSNWNAVPSTGVGKLSLSATKSQLKFYQSTLSCH